MTLTLVNGLITDVLLNLTRDTAVYTQIPGRDSPDLIKAINTTDIDVLGGSTWTSNGIRDAGREALLTIPGVTEENIGYEPRDRTGFQGFPGGGGTGSGGA